MFTTTDYDKLQHIMDESPEKTALIQKLLNSHKITISTISHEIRNPLTLVYSTLQLIESQHPEVTTYKHWSDMLQDVEYMKHLLEELSSFNNGETIHLSSIDFQTFFKSLVLSFATSLVDTDIEFTSKIEPDLPVIKGDAVKLKEVYLNLLKNAADAVSAGGSIYFHAYTDNGNVIVTVKDDGCGIHKEDIADIFEPFVTHKQGGTGLGLAVSSRIVKAHGGALLVQSDPYVSTVFTVSLPIKKDT